VDPFDPLVFQPPVGPKKEKEDPGKMEDNHGVGQNFVSHCSKILFLAWTILPNHGRFGQKKAAGLCWVKKQLRDLSLKMLFPAHEHSH
jgi:hypothetical protein